MNLRRGVRDEPDVNLTPLIDVVFNILLFFVVSTTFAKESNLRLTLPQASPTVQTSEVNSLELMIDAQGQYFIDGKALLNRQLETVRNALRKEMEGGERPVIIRADAKTPHQAVVTAMDAAGQAGIKQLSIATVPNDD